MIESSGYQTKNKGAVLIEFAIILPLLLIIMIGVLEIALFLMQDNTLNKSVRESSRYLARNLGFEGCYTNIAQDVVAENMNNLFPYIKNDSSRAFVNKGTYTAETICVNDSSGTITNPADIGNSCTSTSATCATGSHLHVRIRATYMANMVTGGLILPSWGNINFAPTLSAASIMRVQ